MTKLRAGLSALLLALMSAWFLAMPAHADSSAPITRYDVKVNLTDKGVAQVTVNFTMDFSVVSGRGPIVLLPTVQDDGANPKEEYVFEYSNFKVSSPSGASAQVSKTTERDGIGLKIGNKNRVNHGPEDYTLSYNVKGFIASNQAQSGLDEFSWNVIGRAWESRISNVTVEVTGPAGVQKSACFYGRDYTTPCSASQSGDTAKFAVDTPLSPREPVQVVAGFPGGTFGGVEQKKQLKPSLSNAFGINPVTGGVAGAGVLASIAALFTIYRKKGRDDVYLGVTPGLTPGKGDAGNIGKASGAAPVTVQFNPPKGSTPGEIGTLIDATADNVDVSATLVDLAVRGYLKIESDGGKNFTLFALVPPANDDLLPYEARLLSDVFQGKSQVTSSALSGASHQDDLSNARTGLYNAVVRKGWFKGNPASAQAVPITFGGLALLGAGGLAFLLAGAGWSLIAVPVAIFGIGLIAMSGKFRTRTALGSATLAQAKGFELYLKTAEKDTLRFEEGEDIFSKYLPYAMVFGVADRWSKLFATLGEQGIYRADTSWYVGADLYHGFAFANAMNNLAYSMSSSFDAARAAGMSASTGSSSGFSGFSGGGGFGGGGGGSW